MKTPHRTAAQLELNFTKEKGIAIQARHLEEFKSVMTAPAYDKLEQLVTANNKDAYDGFDVIRGNQLDMLFRNEVIPVFYRQ